MQAHLPHQSLNSAASDIEAFPLQLPPRLAHAVDTEVLFEDASDPLSGAEEALFAVLKALRLPLARERGVPAYVVFPNRTLIDMARRQPRRREEFAQVNGVGAAKLAQFTWPFLAAIDSALSDAG